MNLSTYLADVESAASFSRRLDIPPALLSQWRSGVRRVPAERCVEIEKATEGRVRCEELRADIDWAAIRLSFVVGCSDPNPAPEVTAEA